MIEKFTRNTASPAIPDALNWLYGVIEWGNADYQTKEGRTEIKRVAVFLIEEIEKEDGKGEDGQ